MTVPRAALFDVDGVILRGKGLTSFARYLVARREIAPSFLVRGTWYALGHRLGWLDGATILRRITGRYLAGRAAAELAAQGEAWFATDGAAAIYPDARALVDAHRRADTPVILLSGGMDFLVAPIARALGATRHVAVRPEVRDGRLTGRLLDPLCIDAGKLHWSRATADELGIDLGDCVYYTDDFGDLGLLELVGEPVVVNPDPRLRQEAARRRWPVRDFAGRSARAA